MARSVRTTPKAERRSGRLERSEIVEAALRLVDEEGLDRLTMRRLAERLGCDPMAVYFYLANKDALLDALAERLEAEASPSAEPHPDPVTALLDLAQSQLEAAIAHPNAALILGGRASDNPVTRANREFARARLAALGARFPEDEILYVATLNGVLLYYAAIVAREGAKETARALMRRSIGIALADIAERAN